jgi:energy-coupling factor transporter ATP-binding protein EcfA2
MFLNLLMFNVRKAGSVEYVFSDRGRILLSGKNGAGKSTIKEALAFALTGRDSTGGQCPVHLVSRGSTGLKVVLKTRDWTIKRTLTLKKSSSLTVESDNIPEFKANNADLLKIIGHAPEGPDGIPGDIYLAAVLPGLFMAQTPSKRFSMLSTILPKFDRAKYVSDISGYSYGEVMHMCGSFLRGIPNHQNFAPYRVELQKIKSRMEGRIEQINRNIEEGGLKPEPCIEEVLLPIAEKHLEDINSYNAALFNFSALKNQSDYAVLENTRRMQKRRDLEQRLSEISVYEPLMNEDEGPIRELQKKLQVLSEKPSTASLPETDRCPTCGQIVGASLRGQMAAENERAKKAYEEHLQAAVAHNDKIYKEMLAVQEQLKIAKEHNNRVRENFRANGRMEEELTKQLQELAHMPVPSLPDAPSKPAHPEILIQHAIGPHKKDILRLRDAVDHYNKKLGIYEKALEDQVKGEAEVVELRKEIVNTEAHIAKRERFEHALRTLAQEEVMSQKEALHLDNYHIDFSEGFDVIHKSGTPYECLSSGEKLYLNILLCMKFQKFLSNKIGWCFVDDADLLHDLSIVDKLIPEGVQVFYAAATAGCEGVNVSNIKE